MDTPIARKFKAHARKEQEEALQDEREDGELDELPNVPQPSQQRAITVVDDPMPPQITAFPPSPLTDEQRQQRRDYFHELRDTISLAPSTWYHLSSLPRISPLNSSWRMGRSLIVTIDGHLPSQVTDGVVVLYSSRRLPPWPPSPIGFHNALISGV